MITRICLIRHGETAWNVERRVQGQTDTPLNATGVAQAHAAARGLAGVSFAAAYSSDLCRARHTADIIGRSLGLAARPHTALRERHYGGFEALTYAEARSRHPEDYVRFERREAAFDLRGGESLSAFAARAVACVDGLAQRHRGERILIVTHGGVLDVLRRHVTGQSLSAPRNFDIPNAAYNWIERSVDGWAVAAWADRRHLDAALDELPG